MVDITKNIQRDKLAHFFASYVVLVVLSVFFSIWVSYVSVFVLVVLKDVVNDFILKKGTFDLKDMIFGTLPIIFDIISKLWS